MTKPEWQLVTNKKLLASLSKKGHFTFPTKFGGGCQINEKVNGIDKPMRFKQFSNSYGMEIEYEIRYQDGSFYPFLYMKVPSYRLTSSYGFSY